MLRLLLLVLPVVSSSAAFVHWQPSSHPIVTSSKHPRICNELQLRRTELHVLATEISDLDVGTVPVLPAKKPLDSFFSKNGSSNLDQEFSILSWNILLPNSQDNWWNHKMYASWVPMEKRLWPHRQALIQDRLLRSGADIVCIQEADGDTFQDDFAFMKNAGYEYCLHKKFRFRCATFFKREKFTLEQESHKDRVLVTSLQSVQNPRRLLNVVNCHLSGGAAPERRLRQVHDAVDQIRKWKNKAEQTLAKQRKANRPSLKNVQKAQDHFELLEHASVIVCGDFNSDGNTGVRQYLVNGGVDPDWREPQYPNIPLTSKRKEHSYCFFDAVELAYGANVCDGDYGEEHALECRPATYVVPNLASLLLLPIQKDEGAPRTQFGHQIARGLADTLELETYNETEIDSAFESMDEDGSNLIEKGEVQKLLESVYVNTYGRHHIMEESTKFFGGSMNDRNALSREEFTHRLITLQQELDGGSEGSKRDKLVSRGIIDTLGLRQFSKDELDRAFESIDLDGNGFIEEHELQKLLESVFVSTYGRSQIEEERKNFFRNFWGSASNVKGLSRDHITEKLKALQQELEGGTEGTELVEIRTEADLQRMIARFTPMLKAALDYAFDNLSSDGGESLTREEVEAFLIKTNGQVGRGGTWRHKCNTHAEN